MKTFKIDITRPTKKGSEVLKTLFVNSNISDNKLANAYRTHYSPFDVSVTEVEVVDEKIVDEKIENGIIIERHEAYMDPSHTIEYTPENKTLSQLAAAYIEKEAELKAAKNAIATYFGDYINRPEVSSVSSKVITIRGYFKQNILLDRMPEKTE